MTRRIDRLYEQRRAEDATRADRHLFREQVEAKAAASANELRDLLGIGPDLTIRFGTIPVLESAPDAANDAAIEPEKDQNRA